MMHKHIKKFFTLLRFTRIHHSLFALPFLFLGVLEYTSNPDIFMLIAAIVAFIGIRAFAIVYGDIIDLDYDRMNPRARNRPLVTGEISIREAWITALILLLIYLIGIYYIDHVIYLLFWIPISLILIYPYLKRYIPISHFWLGLILSIAPWGGYIVFSKCIEPGPIDLAIALAIWVAGFDIIYHIQDIEVSKRFNIKTIPSVYGIKGSIQITELLYTLSIILLLINWIRMVSGLTYLTGILLSSIILSYQVLILNKSVDKENLRRCFNMNLSIGPILLIFLLIRIYLKI